MFTRNKGIFSLSFLLPNLSLLFSILVVETAFRTWVRPAVKQIQIVNSLKTVQGGEAERSLFIVIKDPEQEIELMFFLWATILLTYKLVQVGRERRLLNHDFIGAKPGERIIPDDALDRYKELKNAVEANARWRERYLPEFILAALHRFHATNSVQDAASAVKERAELVADDLDSALSLIRYVAWAIPAIGFIGTVRGIGDALAQAEKAIKGDLSGVTDALGLAFNSTLVALVLSMVLMYMMHMLQARQEGLILELQNYCREKLVDIMKVPTRDETAEVLS